MCVKNCLCNSCMKRNTCSECEYIDTHGIEDWRFCCGNGGITECKYHIDFGFPKDANNKCEFCKGNEIKGTIDDKSFISVHGNELQFNLFTNNTMHEKYYTIEFCPMCGRKL